LSTRRTTREASAVSPVQGEKGASEGKGSPVGNKTRESLWKPAVTKKRKPGKERTKIAGRGETDPGNHSSKKNTEEPRPKRNNRKLQKAR